MLLWNFVKAEIYQINNISKKAKCSFRPSRFSKIDFTQNQSDRKIMKFPHCEMTTYSWWRCHTSRWQDDEESTAFSTSFLFTSSKKLGRIRIGMISVFCSDEATLEFTMLHKVWKCEVKIQNTRICLLILASNQFWQNLNLKNCHFYNFRDFQLCILVNLGFETYLKFTKKSKFRTSINAKNDIAWWFEFTKIWFYVKSEWQAGLKFTFWKFLEKSGIRQSLEIYIDISGKI